MRPVDERAAGLPRLGCAPTGAEDVLRGSPLLRDLDPNHVSSVLAAVSWCLVPSGTTLFEQGDPAEAVYVVVRGRLQVRKGTEVLVERGPGHLVGEAGLLTEGSRSATVCSIRDSIVARLSADDFAALARRLPGLALHVARSSAERVVHGASKQPSPPPRFISVVPGSSDVDIDAFASELAALTPEPSRTVVVSCDTVTQWQRSLEGPERASRWESVEADASLVLAGVDVRELDDGAVLRHSDAVVVVAEVGEPPDRRSVAAVGACGRPVRLVLRRRGGSAPTLGHWRNAVEERGDLAVSHVARNDVSGMARLARVLLGTAVGLVLGGGGARGFAHIGAVRALREAGVAIDLVGGSSMGAIIGAQVADGWPVERLLEENRSAWSRRLLARPRWPTISLSSGERVNRLLRSFFGDRRIEELALGFFCTTADLTQFRLNVVDRGPVADWVGASGSVPGLWPPLVDSDGHLHVDGGILDNVPTAVMKERMAGPVVAVDVCARQAEMRVTPPSLADTWGLSPLRRQSGTEPSIVDLLGRSNLLASLQRWEEARSSADIYLTPQTAPHGFSSFDRVAELAELGYRSVVAQLENEDVASIQHATGSSTRSSRPIVL